MSHAPHRWAIALHPPELRSGRVQVLKKLLRAVRYSRPDTPAIGARRQVAHYLRCIPHLEAFRDWFGNPAHPALQEALAQRPSLPLCVVHPYLNAAWSAQRKLDVVGTHYAMLGGRLGFLRFAPPGSITLADAGEGLQVRLDKPGKFEHEGELTINLFSAEQRLFSLVFTLGRMHAQQVAWVGGLQGLNSPDALETYRALTHSMHGLRPRDLLLAVFRMLCLALGVARILAVSDARRVSTSGYFESCTQVFSSYDSAWLEGGGVAVADGFFELSPNQPQRAPEDVPSRKRALYRRRYAMLDALAQQIDEAVRLASRDYSATPGSDSGNAAA